MNPGPGTRKRRSRSQTPRRHSESQSAAEHQAAAAHDREESAATFWARSNARLSIDPAEGGPTKRGQSAQGGEFVCAACGTLATYERNPKTLCEPCHRALYGQQGLISGGEREIAQQLRQSSAGQRARKKHEGLPRFDKEDLEALADLRALNELGTGRNANRRKSAGPLFSTGAGGLDTQGGARGQRASKPGSEAGRGRKKRRPTSAEGQGQAQGQSSRRATKGGPSQRGPRAQKGEGSRAQAQPAGPQAQQADGQNRRRRRRRKVSKPGEGGPSPAN